MKKWTKNDWILLVSQVVGWMSLWLIPAAIAFSTELSSEAAWGILRKNGEFVLWYSGFYFLNFYGLVPYLLFKKRVRWFLLGNAGVILFHLIGSLSEMVTLEPLQEWRPVLYLIGFGILFSDSLVVAAPVAIRYALRWNETRLALQEEKRKHADAELAWLKNQLNPHFLFNTLNNISSLVQIDADSAQESIGQLSDLLRYALYESNHESVPLENEVEFMTNYIDLMKLRCNELTQVDTYFAPPPHPVRVAPLLFISVIENAFKHGVNSRKHSFVRISLTWQGNDLIFTAENSNDPKRDADRSGSGIGVENLRRRLELLYPNRYRYEQELKGDTYFVKIVLNGL
ncbi:MAG: histidine kinase [Parabacteroides sp.]|nr:histidine kinase [Parabacteroides sp.]